MSSTKSTTSFSCLNCEKEVVLSFDVKRRKFCSDKCGQSWHSAESYKKRRSAFNPDNPGTRRLICSQCEETFEQTIKRGRLPKYCSDSCRVKSKLSMSRNRYFPGSRYRLSQAEYDTLISSGCSVCGSTDRLCVDHDHSCCPPKVQKTCGFCTRGVLCHKCNTADGLLDSDPDRMIKLAAYVRNTRTA